MNQVHCSSQTCEWETPRDLYLELHREFGFGTDVCANRFNAKCARYFSLEQDGLQQEWTGVIWCNPPYGRQIGQWVRKAYESAMRGAKCVLLVPARTDTRWWHLYVTRASEVRFLRGRIRFGGGEHPAPFPSAVVVFDPCTVELGSEVSHWACYGPAIVPARVAVPTLPGERAE